MLNENPSPSLPIKSMSPGYPSSDEYRDITKERKGINKNFYYHYKIWSINFYHGERLV